MRCWKFCQKHREPGVKGDFDLDCNKFATPKDIQKLAEHSKCMDACKDCRRLVKGASSAARFCFDEFSSRFRCPEKEPKVNRPNLIGEDLTKLEKLKIPLWSILLIVVCIVILLAAFVTFFVYLCKQRPKPQRHDRHMTSGLDRVDSDVPATGMHNEDGFVPEDGGIFSSEALEYNSAQVKNTHVHQN